MQCDQIAPELAGVVDGTVVLDHRSSAHVASCLRCQAELAQYRRLLRTLHQLREEAVPVPGDMVSLVLARLDEVTGGRVSPWARRAAYAGAAVATAAGAAGAIALVASRNRRLRLAG
jgi:anti-sigma factor RsiW